MTNKRYWTSLREETAGKALEDLAAKDERSVQFTLRTAVLQYLRKRGWMEKDEDYR